MKTNIFGIVFVVVGAFGLSCMESTIGDGDNTLGAVFSALSGKYRIPDSTCYVQIDGSSITAVGEDGQSPCTRSEDGGYEGFDETLTIDGTITESSVTGTMVYKEAHWVAVEGCEFEESLTHTFDLDMSKERGAQQEGMFASLAGAWAGRLAMEELYDGAALDIEGCIDEDVTSEERITFGYEVDADIGGDSAEISYFKVGRSYNGTFEVENTGNDMLVIGDKAVSID